MPDLAPSLNVVTLTGVMHAAPRKTSGADGRPVVELEVVTGVDGRSIRHRVRVVDPELAISADETTPGAAVAVVGELDYDSSGAFIAVLARRSCDIRFGGVAASSSAPVRSESAPAVQAATLQAPAPVKATVVAPDPVVEEPVVEPDPASASEEAPEAKVVEAEAAPSTTSAAPVAKTGGFGGFGSFGGGASAAAPAAVVDKPAQAPAPTQGRSAFKSLMSSTSTAKPQEEADVIPQSAQEEPAKQSVSRPAFQSNFSRPAMQQAPVGADSLDDDIPF